MTPPTTLALASILALVTAMHLPGCGKSSTTTPAGADGAKVTWQDVRKGSVTVTNPDTGVEWTIVAIMTDNMDNVQAKANAEDMLNVHDNIAAMVGLWAYNPPLIHQAVTAAGRIDEIAIVGFDEDQETLDAIAKNEIVGTVVQNPYEFGFRSVEMLSAIARGQGEALDIPDDGMLYIDTQVIRQDNVADFAAAMAAKLSGNGPVLGYDADAYDTSERVDIHFVANGVADFWTLAGHGCNTAGPEFNAAVSVYLPPNGQVEEQKRYIQDMITNGADGLAVSPISADGQDDIINQAAAAMAVIACDSDAPNSDRLFYLGTNNYAAGRQAGQMVAEGCPEGGKVVIFVGKLEVLNAQERSQGVIDYLLGQ